jgi:hypothetical protein
MESPKEIICKECGKEISYMERKHTFCNSICKNKWWNKRRKKAPKNV